MYLYCITYQGFVDDRGCCHHHCELRLGTQCLESLCRHIPISEQVRLVHNYRADLPVEESMAIAGCCLIDRTIPCTNFPTVIN
jgi:hypothetical protein